MKRYEAYKDSGVDWIGEIPEHWEFKRLGALLTIFSSKNHTDKPLLSITRERGVILRDLDDETENHNFIPDDLSGYKLMKEGQFGMNKMKAWQGSYGISEYDGIVSPAYFIFDVAKEIYPKFFHRAIRSKFYIAHFGSASDGVRIGQWDLSKPRMREIPFFIPPITEQQTIANFLDDKTTKIDQTIGIRQREIELLKERRQILIQKAVTKGLDATVPMKPSGVDWIGEIPEHWEMKPGRTIFKERKQSNKGLKNSVVLSLSYGKIIIKPEEKMFGLVPESFETYQLVYEGDIIIRGTDLQNDKTSLRTGISLYQGIITSAYINLNVKEDNLPSFIQLFLYVMDISKEIYKYGSGLRQNLSFNDFKLMPILKVPFKEQTQIVSYLEEIEEKISKAISIKQQEIEKLKEYKTVLIDNVVTGKVRITQN